MRECSRVLALLFVLIIGDARECSAQVPVESEVRQIVMFSFLPGMTAEAVSLFRNQAILLYEKNEAMLSFRGFREVESPIPMDLIVVSSFQGMTGMDASNAKLRSISKAGIGELYGAIGDLATAHTDQFVEMLPALGSGDSSSKKLTAFIWYRIVPGELNTFEDILQSDVVPWETSALIPSATGRFLVSDGWHYLRVLGFESLGEYQLYWSSARQDGGHDQIDALTAKKRELIVASDPSLSVR